MATERTAQVPTVEQKGADLAPNVEKVAEAVYWVPSWSGAQDEHGDAFHVVTDLGRLGVGEGLRCDCVAGGFAKRCAHVAAVELRRRQAAERRG